MKPGLFALPWFLVRPNSCLRKIQRYLYRMISEVLAKKPFAPRSTFPNPDGYA